MVDLPHIPKDIIVRESKDFSFLRDKGIELAQQLAGEVWTDYNEHDPGVTILEQLCYALTDLGYRTDYHIRDILAPPPHETEPPPDTLYTGDRILPTRPISRVDYRKLLYDRIKGVKNIWLQKAEGPNVEGLYDVLIDIFEAYDSDEDKNRILSDTWGYLIAFRNLTEDFHRVKILEKADVKVEARVVIGPYPTPETILANILYSIQNTLAPFPRLVTIDQLFQQKRPPDEIFDGPNLLLGAIDDASLTPLPTEIRFSQILGAIRSVEGVITIEACRVTVRYEGCKATMCLDDTCDDDDDCCEDDDQGNRNDRVCLNGRIPHFTPDIFEKQEAYSIEICRDEARYPVDTDRVWRKVRGNQENLLNEYIYARKTMADAAYGQVTPGVYKDLSTYSSIQNHFPLTYGIGPYGIPNQLYYPVNTGDGGMVSTPSASEMRQDRQIRAWQLKAYLLFFEQIMIDYQAQLAHVRDLFSLKKNMQRSYFTQALFTVPGVSEVLPDRSTLAALPPAVIVPEVPDNASFARRIIMLSDDELPPEYRGAAEKKTASIAVKVIGMSDTEWSFGYLDAVERVQGQNHITVTVIDNASKVTPCEVNDATEVAYSYKGACAARPPVLAEGVVVRVKEGLGSEDILVARFIIVLDADERVDAPPPTGAITALDAEGIEVNGITYGIDDATEVVYSYKKELDKIVQAHDPFLDRRNTFLDHLLARFSERFDTYSLDRLDVRKSGDKDGFYEDLIGWKQSFLKDYIALSRARSRGFKHYRPYGLNILGDDFEVILYTYDLVSQAERVEREIDILVYGADEPHYRLKPLLHGESVLVLTNGQGKELARGMDTLFSNTDDIRKQAAEPICDTIKKIRKNIRDAHRDKTEAGSPKAELLTRNQLETVYAKNEPPVKHIARYPRGNWPLDSGAERRARLLLGIAEQPPRLVPPPSEEASASEGFYLVEHILLWPIAPKEAAPDAPGSTQAEVEIALPLASGEAEFDSKEAAQDGIEALAAFLRKIRDDEGREKYIKRIGPRGYAVSVVYPRSVPPRDEQPDPNKPYGVRIVDDNSVILLSMYNLESKAVREQRIQDILAFGSDAKNYRMRENPYGEISLDLYKTRSLKGDIFYSYRVSVFFPDWPARFKQNGFKKLAKQVVRENCPAHVAAQFFWLNQQDMATFETIYYDWVNAKATMYKYDPDEGSLGNAFDTVRTSHQETKDARSNAAQAEGEAFLKQIKRYLNQVKQFARALLVLAEGAEIQKRVDWKKRTDNATNPKTQADHILRIFNTGRYAHERKDYHAAYFHYFMAWIQAEREKNVAEIAWRAAVANQAVEEQQQLEERIRLLEEVINLLLAMLAEVEAGQDKLSELVAAIDAFAEEVFVFADTLLALEDEVKKGVQQKKDHVIQEIDTLATKLKWFIVEQQDKQRMPAAQGA